MNQQKKRLPVTIITGFLGSGKTTLIRHLLQKGQSKFAVIVNEFGSIGLDGALFESCGFCPESELEGRLVELNNGCICCTVQEDFLPTLQKLLSLNNDIEGIVIETSGLALPQPLLKALDWPEIRSQIYVDGLITVADGEALSLGSPVGDLVALEKQRDEDENIDHKTPLNELFNDQLLESDLVLISRSDIISKKLFDDIKVKISKIVKPEVQILPMQNGQIEPSLLIGLQHSNNTRVKPEESHHHNHLDVFSYHFKKDFSFDSTELKELLISLVEEYQIIRIKGRNWVKGKIYPQQVQMVGSRFNCWYEKAPDYVWKPQDAGLELIVLSFRSGIQKELSKKFDMYKIYES